MKIYKVSVFIVLGFLALTVKISLSNINPTLASLAFLVPKISKAKYPVKHLNIFATIFECFVCYPGNESKNKIP